jgi:hypothetical protein
MQPAVNTDERRPGRGGAETVAHQRLKRLALIWAQAHGYAACAMEVSRPRCRYRADLVAYRMQGEEESTAVFECKQAREDLRRDNGCAAEAEKRLADLHARRCVLERNLRVHFPSGRLGDSLFVEFESHDFNSIGHRGYARVVRQLGAWQNRLFDATKFEKLFRYRCANLLFLVLSDELFRPSEVPYGWGALVERDGALSLAVKPIRQELPAPAIRAVLTRIASAGTRALNRQLEITFDNVTAARGRTCP